MSVSIFFIVTEKFFFVHMDSRMAQMESGEKSLPLFSKGRYFAGAEG